MSGRHDAILLADCAKEPLYKYLKALGVFRIVANQVDIDACGCWEKTGVFCLQTGMNRDELLDFFMTEYRPTPLLAPWNGGSGFWKETNAAGRALQAMRTSTHPRLALYRDVISVARSVIEELGLTKKPDDNDKLGLLRTVRARVPDEVVPWIDATWAMGGDRSQFSPLLGTGANDGNFEFTSNFLQRLADIILFHTKETGEQAAASRSSGTNRAKRGGGVEGPSPHSRGWLAAALFGDQSPSLLSVSIGQFHPGGAGGANGTFGFEAGSLTNPWDYVLMMEGCLLFAGAVSRRLGSRTGPQAAFPFTVDFSAAGSGTLSATERQSVRKELWLPIWGHPTPIQELARLFAEGRAQVRRRPAANGVDFARAVVGLGVSRGLVGFQRYTFVQRNGLAYIAAPLGHFAVRHRPAERLIDEADPWLRSLRAYVNHGDAPASAAQHLRRIEDAIVDFCSLGGTLRFEAILRALGSANRDFASSKRSREWIRPLQGLSAKWVAACDDNSVAVRIAASIASIRNVGLGSIRRQIEGVEWDDQSRRWKWREGNSGVAWKGRDLPRNLHDVLDRRYLEAERGEGHAHPLKSELQVRASDVENFLLGQVDDRRIEELIFGFLAVKGFAGVALQRVDDDDLSLLPRSYMLLKLLFHRQRIAERWHQMSNFKQTGESDRPPIRVQRAVLGRLRGEDLPAALSLTARRLRINGLDPIGTDRRRGHLFIHGEEPVEVQRRLGGSLLIPLHNLDKLAGFVLRPSPEQEGHARGEVVSEATG